MSENLCPCHSGLAYFMCCEPYHRGSPVPDAQALMRSRYSAYALGNVDYILETSHQTRRLSQQEIRDFCSNVQFRDLTIHSFVQKDHEAFVEFTAHLTKGGHDVSFRERSRFLKVGGVWKYVEGSIRSPQSY